MIQTAVFIIASILLIAISWKSLRKPNSHGFYRFFVWEAIAALVVINAPVWFKNPASWNQIISWILLIACFVPLGFGVQSLRTQGKPTEQRAGDSSLMSFEKTTQLVTSGIYHYIRHPLYSSLLLLAWGVFFKSISWIGGLLIVIATLFLLATAKADETECIRYFGDEYQTYMQYTKRFIPYLV